MIKSIADTATEKNTAYPILKNVMGLKWRIVLFTAPAEGTLVHEDTDGVVKYKVGNYSKSWAEDQFEPFVGSITLSNGQ